MDNTNIVLYKNVKKFPSTQSKLMRGCIIYKYSKWATARNFSKFVVKNDTGRMRHPSGPYKGHHSIDLSRKPLEYRPPAHPQISFAGVLSSNELQKSNLNWKPVASFTKDIKPRLSKRPLVFNGCLSNRRLNSLVKEIIG